MYELDVSHLFKEKIPRSKRITYPKSIVCAI